MFGRKNKSPRTEFKDVPTVVIPRGELGGQTSLDVIR
jgi:hypothetical protein